MNNTVRFRMTPAQLQRLRRQMEAENKRLREQGITFQWSLHRYARELVLRALNGGMEHKR